MSRATLPLMRRLGAGLLITFLAMPATVPLAAQQPIGTAVEGYHAPVQQPAPATQRPTPSPAPIGTVAPPASNAPNAPNAANAASGVVAARRAARAEPVAAALPSVRGMALEPAGDSIRVSIDVHGDVPWSVSEPYYLGDRVRLHVDIAAPRDTGFAVPAPDGSLLDVGIAADADRTRLVIDVTGVVSYDAIREADAIVLRILPGAPFVPEVVGAVAPLAPTDRASSAAALTRRAAAVAGEAMSLAGRGVAAARALGAVALHPSNRSMLAVALGTTLALLAGLVAALASRRARPVRTSIVLGGRPPAPVVPVVSLRPALAPATGARPAKRSSPAPAAGRGPVSAHSLAAAGLSRGEIAARLRVSRDVVALMLVTPDRSDEAAAAGRNFPAGRASRARTLFGRTR